MKNIDFTCPKCGADDLEEVMEVATVISPITDIEFNEDDPGFHSVEYDHPDVWDGEVSHFQCAKCGQGVRNEAGHLITDTTSLIEWLIKRK